MIFAVIFGFDDGVSRKSACFAWLDVLWCGFGPCVIDSGDSMATRGFLKFGSSVSPPTASSVVPGSQLAGAVVTVSYVGLARHCCQSRLFIASGGGRS